MKYLRNYKIYENKSRESIEILCREYVRKGYISKYYTQSTVTINDDGSVDVDGNVDFSRLKLTEIPLNFNRISGHFDCSQNHLISLKNSPKYVGGVFACNGNNLKSLEYSPKEVRCFHCFNNNLISLKGCPEIITNDLICAFNQITSLEGCPRRISGGLDCTNNNILSLEFCPEYIGGKLYMDNNPINNIIKYFQHFENRDALIDLFNDLDIVQNKNVIFNRLKYFFEEIDVDLTKKRLDQIGDEYEIIK